MTDLDHGPEPPATGFSTRAVRAPSCAPLRVPVGLEDVQDLPADSAEALAAARAVVPALGAV